MNITTIDFECFYSHDFTLRKLTIPEYVGDPRFHAHGLAVRWPDGRCEFLGAEDAVRRLLSEFGSRFEGTTVVCHNTYFDLYVLARKYGVHPNHFIDTMLLSHHIHGRLRGSGGQNAKLSALAERYGLTAKGDLEFMRGVRNPDAVQQADLELYALDDVRITAELAERLLPHVSRPEVELPVMMHTVRMLTQRSIQIDTPEINVVERKICAECDRALEDVDVSEQVLSSDKQFAVVLESALARSGRKIALKQGKNDLIPAVGKKDEAMQNLLDDDDTRVAALARARLEKKGKDAMLSRISTLRNIASVTGGFLPPHLVYCGCHTGRFAGGGGFNVQNLGCSGLGAAIRGLLIARPQHQFIIADFSQIEARITAWFASEWGMLEAFRDQRDLYAEFASRTFGQPVRKPRDGDDSAKKEVLFALRQVGKKAVLGLGFGMGALTFMNELRSEPTTSQLFECDTLSPKGCRDIVQDFRDTYPGIPAYWQELEKALRPAVE